MPGAGEENTAAVNVEPQAEATATPETPPTNPHRKPTPPPIVHPDQYVAEHQNETADNDSFHHAEDSATLKVEAAQLADDSHIVDKLGAVFLWISIPVTVVCCVIAGVLYTRHDIEAVTVSHSIAGLCAFTSLVLTSVQIFMHLSVYTNPHQQRFIIRIILMCPIYAIDSFVGLAAYRYATVVNLMRDSYESYVIYMFFKLLMDYLGGEEATLAAWAETKPDMPHLFPFCCLPHVKLNRTTLNIWKICLLQYMILNPVLTLISLPLYFTGNYHEGDLTITSAYAWFSGIMFISVTFAFTSLVYFFFASKHLLMHTNPLPKFAAIKTVVFLSFWQTVLLAGLNHFKVIPHSQHWTAAEVATGLGNFVLCVEMYLITIAHRWIFTDAPYRPETGRSKLTWWAFRHAFAVTDVISDTQAAAGLISPLLPPVARRGNGDSAAQSTEQAPTEVSEVDGGNGSMPAVPAAESTAYSPVEATDSREAKL